MGLVQNALGGLFGKNQPEQSPAARARCELGLEDMQGETLILALAAVYKGNCVDVYRILLDMEINDQNFYPLQGEVLGITMRDASLQKYGEHERVVRAIAKLAQRPREEIIALSKRR